MRLAYLTNHYPHPRRGFVCDEIAALEARGAHVERFSLHPSARRPSGSTGPDEPPPVHVIRTRSVLAFLYVTFATLWSRPVTFFAALRMAMRIARKAERRTWGNLMRLA